MIALLPLSAVVVLLELGQEPSPTGVGATLHLGAITKSDLLNKPTLARTREDIWVLAQVIRIDALLLKAINNGARSDIATWQEALSAQLFKLESQKRRGLMVTDIPAGTQATVISVDGAEPYICEVELVSGLRKGQRFWYCRAYDERLRPFLNEERYLYGKGTTIGVPLAFAREHYEVFIEASNNGDQALIQGLVEKDRIFYAPEGSRVRVVERDLSPLVRVVIEDGPKQGRRAWCSILSLRGVTAGQ